MLGAVTDDGDSFYCWTEENLTRFHGIRLLEALKDKFGKELVVFLDLPEQIKTKPVVCLQWHYLF